MKEFEKQLIEDIGYIKAKVEGLQKKFSELEEDVEELFRIRDMKTTQLTHPLDSISQKVIKELSFYPVVTKLEGTSAVTAANYGKIFTADKMYVVKSVVEVHGTAGSDGSAVTLQIERLQGTEALDAGDALLSTAFDLKGTADTVQFGSLVTDNTLLLLNRGDRLALKDAGALTSVADVQVTVYLSLV